MSEPHSYLEDPTALEPAAALRAELAHVRAQAEAQKQRLERELKLARSAQPSQRDPVIVTQNVAGRQEIQALRNTLREKDRVIEQLTTQCRDLEDQLEDNFQQLDALRLRVQQRELELDQAQARRRSAQRPRARAPARDVPAQDRPEPLARPASMPTPPPAPSGHRGSAPSAFIGLLIGTLLSVGTAAGLWWSGHWPAPRMRLLCRSAARLRLIQLQLALLYPQA